LNKLKRMFPQAQNTSCYNPVAGSREHSFYVKYFMPINMNCMVYWEISFSLGREDIRNNHRCIDNGKYKHHQRNPLNDNKYLSGIGEFYVI